MAKDFAPRIYFAHLRATRIDDGGKSISGYTVLRLANGSACGGASQCSSGFCSDGVCCDQPCSGGCDACSVAAGGSSNGVCTVRAAGAWLVASITPRTCKRLKNAVVR